jgi:hypothetical protein
MAPGAEAGAALGGSEARFTVTAGAVIVDGHQRVLPLEKG